MESIGLISLVFDDKEIYIYDGTDKTYNVHVLSIDDKPPVKNRLELLIGKVVLYKVESFKTAGVPLEVRINTNVDPRRISQGFTPYIS